MNFKFTLEDPTSFTFNNSIYESIQTKKNQVFDYDNPRYENLRVVLDKLLKLVDEFKIVHSQNNLIKCEIIHAQIMYETFIPAIKLVNSEIEKTKVEFKSSLDRLSKKIKTDLSNVDSEDQATILSYLNLMDSYYPKLDKQLQFMNYTILKHQIKRWTMARYDSLDKTFRDDCIELWQKIHNYEGIWLHVTNLCGAIMSFDELIVINYD